MMRSAGTFLNQVVEARTATDPHPRDLVACVQFCFTLLTRVRLLSMSQSLDRSHHLPNHKGIASHDVVLGKNCTEHSYVSEDLPCNHTRELMQHGIAAASTPPR